jgi:4-hydroxybenzoate polyprenyltransferase
MSLKRGTLFSIIVAIVLVLVALVNLSWATWLAVIYLFAYGIYSFISRRKRASQK